MLIIIAAIGVVWMIMCIDRGYTQFKSTITKHIEEFKRTRGRPPTTAERCRLIWDNLKTNFPKYWKDFVWSLVLTLAGALIFKGVAGMMIGLVASVLLSVYVELEQIAKTAYRNFTGQQPAPVYAQ